jgi:hypothetical protein
MKNSEREIAKYKMEQKQAYLLVGFSKAAIVSISLTSRW